MALKLATRLLIVTLMLLPTAVSSQDVIQVARGGNVRQMKELLESDSTLVNVADERGRSSLHYAASANDTTMLEELLSRGAEVDLEDVYGMSPLLRASVAGNLEAVRILCQSGADYESINSLGQSVLHAAAKGGHEPVVQYFLSLKVNINGRSGDGLTPLHFAANYGHDAVVSQLVENGAEVNIQSKFGFTPLHLAAAGGHNVVVGLLLAGGADPNLRSANGASPLNFASWCGHEDVVELLESGGAEDGPAYFPDIRGANLGQREPGIKPEPFAPGIVLAANYAHSGLAVSPHGSEIFWSAALYGFQETIWTMRMENGLWTPPEIADFSGEYLDGGPFFAPDGSGIYFYSRRPVVEGGEPPRGVDYWFAGRTEDGWAAPVHTGTERFTISRNGDRYFSVVTPSSINGSDIWVQKYINGEYAPAEPVGQSVNSVHSETNPYIAPDESFVIFYSNRPDGFRVDDELYISFRDDGGNWTKAVNMGEDINRIRMRAPALSGDGRFLFLLGEENGIKEFYWVNASVLDSIRASVIGQ